jgi:hypothetical protein
MVIEEYNEHGVMGENFTCQDLVKDHQKWGAYEFRGVMSDKPYNWRIATDDDIANYLSRFLDISLGKVGQFYVAKLTDNGIVLKDTMFTDSNIYLEANELIDLKRIIDERVG